MTGIHKNILLYQNIELHDHEQNKYSHSLHHNNPQIQEPNREQEAA